MKNSFLLTVCLIVGFQLATSQIYKDSVFVEFHQSRTDLDLNFKGNKTRIDSIIDNFTPSPESGVRYHLRSVNVVGAASPEGSTDFNKYLSEKRAYTIFDFMKGRGLATDSIASFTFLGRDWRGLQRAVEQDNNVPYRSEVLELLKDINSKNGITDPLDKLKFLHNGIPYAYLYRNIFPDLRMSKLVVGYDRMIPIVDIGVANPVLLPFPANMECPELEFTYLTGEVKECRPFYLGLKTNLISDILLIPHIGADLYIGKNWSLTADWMYGWWDKDRTHHYWRAYGGTLGVRKWFGKKASEKPLTGHHVGIYAGVVTYDFEFGGRGYMGGRPHGTLWDRCNFVGGVEYGYSMPVSRRINIDFSIGFGYLGGRYLEYVPKDGFYMWESTHHLNWFGPTKAEVSVVWLIGCDNYNRRK